MRPLYLNGADAMRVLLDGPGLRVRAAGTADRLFPLARLSRVVVCGSVDWTTDALIACAQASVPVSFLRHGGALRARVLGAPPRAGWLQFDDLFAEFLELENGLERYHDWVHAQAHHARRELVHAAGRGAWSTEPGDLARCLRLRALRHTRSTDLKRFDGQVSALVRIAIEAQLRDGRIDPDAVDLLIHDIQLAEDLTGAVVWTLQNAKLSWIKCAHNRHRRHDGGLAPLHWYQSISFVESQATSLERRIARLIRRLQIFLLETVNGHGIE